MRQRWWCGGGGGGEAEAEADTEGENIEVDKYLLQEKEMAERAKSGRR